MSTATRIFGRFDGEMFFARRLAEYGVRIHDGVTDENTRKERIRCAIIDHRLHRNVIGKTIDGQAETFQAAFERFFGEPLHPTKSHTGEKNPC